MKRYTPIIISDDSCDMYPSVEETINGALVQYAEAVNIIESMKCCGNCKRCLTMSQVPNRMHHLTYCQPCINNSMWEQNID